MRATLQQHRRPSYSMVTLHPCRCLVQPALVGALRATLLWLLVMAPAHAATTNHIVSQAWFEDGTGRMSWAEVQQQAMTPFSGVLARGYGKAPVWVRLRIDPSMSGTLAGESLYLRIRPAYLDELVLYDALQQPSRQGPIGDRYPLSIQSAHSSRYTFDLPAGAAPRDIWVRLETTSTRMARFEVLNGMDLAVSNGILDMAGSSYLGLLGLFILWGAIRLVLRPEPLIACFVAHQVTALIFGSSMLGYTRLLLDGIVSPFSLNMLTSVVGVGASGLAVLFAQFLLNELSHARWRSRVIGGVLFMFASLLALLLSGRVVEALEVNMWLILVVPTLLLVMAVVSRRGCFAPGCAGDPR